MNSIVLKASAKINLSLDVVKKRDDGYHDIKTIIQSIDLHDKIFIEKTESGIEVLSECSSIPVGKDNIAYKAAELITRKFNINSGIRIIIKKRIPVAAGLGGGSADAAAVLRGINILFSLQADISQLMILGKHLGADVPFCLQGGTVLAEGIGDVLTQLNPLTGVNIVLIKPCVSASTKWVYDNFESSRVKVRPDMDMLIKAIDNNRIDVIARNMRNVLEDVTIRKYNILEKAKNSLVVFGAAGSMMSGSGTAVFGIFINKETAEKAYGSIRNEKWDCYITETTGRGR